MPPTLNLGEIYGVQLCDGWFLTKIKAFPIKERKNLDELNCPCKQYSIFWNDYKLSIPATVHVDVGTDTIHSHPECSGEALGKTSYEDLKLLTESVSKLENRAAINIGSAVLLPEIFSKALNTARNLNFNVKNITAINFDFIDNYRPRVNVVDRQTLHSGKGFNMLGYHQSLINGLALLNQYNLWYPEHELRNLHSKFLVP